MNKHFKRGLISMSLWILFVIVVWGSYLYITKRPFSYFIDEETGGFISATFFYRGHSFGLVSDNTTVKIMT